jgi:hypothetical protein
MFFCYIGKKEIWNYFCLWYCNWWSYCRSFFYRNPIIINENQEPRLAFTALLKSQECYHKLFAWESLFTLQGFHDGRWWFSIGFGSRYAGGCTKWSAFWFV